MRQFLAILATAMLVQSASAQSLWRNFFTTNRDPIVEVVAGSNATVQATTVGSNLRRFTVNSTATGGTNSLVQTNISYVAVTNAPWQFGDSDLTNWATLNTNVLSTLGQTNISYVAVTNAPWQYGSANVTNWGQLGTNVLSTLGQTNISYVAVTNAPWQTGSANLTNWSGISTNLAAFLANNQVFTGSNYFTHPLTLSLATNTPSAGQVLTATSAGSAAWNTPSSVAIPSEMIASYATLFGSNNFWESGENVIFKENFRGSAISPLIVAATAQGGASGFTALVGTDGSGFYRLGCYPTNTGSYASISGGTVANSINTNCAFDCSLIVSSNELTEVSIGFITTIATRSVTDSIRWLANTNLSPNWIAECTANSSSTFVTSSLPVTVGSKVRLSFYSPTTNSVAFYTNGVFAFTISATIPGGRVVRPACRVYATASSGSAALQLTFIDFLWFLWN